MARNYLGPGNNLTLTAPSGGVVSGTAYLIGTIIVVAQSTVAQTLPFEAKRIGLFTQPKATGQTWSEGAALYWDNTAKNFTTTSSGNTLAGVAAAAALSGDTTGSVLLGKV